MKPIPAGRGDALPFEEVLREEIRSIEEDRRLRGRECTSGNGSSTSDPYATAHQARLAGLAFSGGGIRSATFNLGVLQGLAELDLLDRFDYLSTVSGGGYIGSWLAAWWHRCGIRRVIDTLRSPRVDLENKQEAREVQFLREYSNYLTPRRGLFSLDTLTFAGIYLRNLSLNLVVLVLALMAVLIAPRLLVLVFVALAQMDFGWTPILVVWLLFCAPIVIVVRNLTSLSSRSRRRGPGPIPDPTWSVQAFAVLPILLGSWLLGIWLWRMGHQGEQVASRDWWKWGAAGGIAYTMIWIVGGVAVSWRFLEDPAQKDPPSAPIESEPAKHDLATTTRKILERARGAKTRIQEGFEEKVGVSLGRKALTIGVTALFSGALGGLLLLLLACLLHQWNPEGPGWKSAVWSLPLVIFVLQAAATLHIGLAGKGFTEDEREWWGRLGAAVFAQTVIVSGVGALAVFGPLELESVGDPLGSWLKPSLVLGWIATTGLGLVAGKSPSTGGSSRNSALEWVAKIAPYVFVIGLLLLLACLTQALLPTAARAIHEVRHGGAALPRLDEQHNATGLELAHWGAMDDSLDSWLLLISLMVGLGIVALLISWRVGVNEFSMHALYRNRLARCYFGASNEHRNPHPFTGFDPDDDNLRMHELTYAPGSACGPEGEPIEEKVPMARGPYPILNAALNLVGGRNLAWQQRKALSFVFTPHYCGYHVVEEPGSKPSPKLEEFGYRPSSAYAKAPMLATAMAISGAAASPNMGYHSSPPLAFLMTVFNVRLGWWLGNPRHRRGWEKEEPTLGLFYLLFELFGKTDDTRRCVYLSDGGHFENLGVYELVRRRCHLIVASDSGEDHEYKFSDLGNAIEKCRADLGISIEGVDLEPLRLQGVSDRSAKHFAVGRIRYSDADGPKAPDGVFLYLKSSLTGDEPTDVLSYKADHPVFPHQSTGDQWFDEPQFESYRALGHHVARSAFGEPGDVAESESDWQDQVRDRLGRRSSG